MVYPLPWSSASQGHGICRAQGFPLHLTNERKVSVSTHKQVLCALLFLYKQVLEIDLPWMDEIYRPNRPPRLPTVLTEWEVSAVFAEMKGVPALMARLMYGTGMRLMECIGLRVKDVDFSQKIGNAEIRIERPCSDGGFVRYRPHA